MRPTRDSVWIEHEKRVEEEYSFHLQFFEKQCKRHVLVFEAHFFKIKFIEKTFVNMII